MIEHEHPKLNPQELIEAFGEEAREPVTRNLHRYCEKWLANKRWIERVEGIITRLPDEPGPLSLKGLYQVMLPRVQHENNKYAHRIRTLQTCFDLLNKTKIFAPKRYRGTVDIRALKERMDISDIIGRYIPLQKCGPRFKGKCPFHPDKTPSLTVFPNEGRWWCFGCNEGGDVIEFVQRINRFTFREAITELQRS